MSAFPTTRWTLILGASESPEAKSAAWKHLLSTYWPPLYAFFRARGLDATAASDAVQGLCVELLEREVQCFGPVCRRGDELVVIDSKGGVYRDGDAFVMALWALEFFRPWANKAAREPLRSRARSLFHWLSSRRAELSSKLGLQGESHIAVTLDQTSHELEAARCTAGAECSS